MKIMTSIIENQKVSKRNKKRRSKHRSGTPASVTAPFRSLDDSLVSEATGERSGTGGKPSGVKKGRRRSSFRLRDLAPFRNQRLVLIAAGFLLLSAAAYAGLQPLLPATPIELEMPGERSVEKHLFQSLPGEVPGMGSGMELDLGLEPMIFKAVEPKTYTVRSGDTLSEIAKEYGITVRTLIGFNGISDVRRLYVGTELKIPKVDGVAYEVRRGDTLAAIASRNNTTMNRLLDANDLKTDVIYPGDIIFIPGARISEYQYKKAMGTLFIYPTRGRLTSGFGYRTDPFTGRRRFHYAIDLANSLGTPIKATMAGRVAMVGNQPAGYGRYVIIKHANGYQSLYAHMRRVHVRNGQWINQGSTIGEMGNTGRSTGPHLHFSIYKNNTPVNPLSYL